MSSTMMNVRSPKRRFQMTRQFVVPMTSGLALVGLSTQHLTAGTINTVQFSSTGTDSYSTNFIQLGTTTSAGAQPTVAQDNSNQNLKVSTSSGNSALLSAVYRGAATTAQAFDPTTRTFTVSADVNFSSASSSFGIYLGSSSTGAGTADDFISIFNVNDANTSPAGNDRIRYASSVDANFNNIGGAGTLSTNTAGTSTTLTTSQVITVTLTGTPSSTPGKTDIVYKAAAGGTMLLTGSTVAITLPTQSSGGYEIGFRTAPAGVASTVSTLTMDNFSVNSTKVNNIGLTAGTNTSTLTDRGNVATSGGSGSYETTAIYDQTGTAGVSSGFVNITGTYPTPSTGTDAPAYVLVDFNNAVNGLSGLDAFLSTLDTRDGSTAFTFSTGTTGSETALFTSLSSAYAGTGRSWDALFRFSSLPAGTAASNLDFNWSFTSASGFTIDKVAVVPEPGTGLSVISTLAALGSIGRRRRSL